MADNSLAKLFGSSVGLSGKAAKKLPPVRQSVKARRSRSLNNSGRNALSGLLNHYNAMGVPVASRSEQMASLIANQQERERNRPSMMAPTSRSGRLPRLTELGKLGLIAKMERNKINRNRKFREERRRLAPSMNNLTSAFGRASFGAEGRAAPVSYASASPSTSPFSLAPATFTFGGPAPQPLGYAQAKASAQPFSLAPSIFGGPPRDENIRGGSYRKKAATRRKKRSSK